MPINSTTIDGLIEVLNKVKRNGQNEKHTFMNIVTGGKNEMDLFAKRSALARAKRMWDASRVFPHHAEHEIQEMEKDNYPMVGIRGLPNELLARIFELACEEFYCEGSEATSRTRAITFSQVCTRFRATALSTPCLWASVSYDMMEFNGKLEAFLTRSKNAPLTVEILGFTYRHDTLVKFISAVKLHAHRWRKLIVHALHSPDYPSICRAFGSKRLDCPILESIAVRCGHEQIDEGDNTFCLHWNMPALKHLSSTNWCPKPFPDSHLTSLKYVWFAGRDSRQYVPENLQVFINATHSLRDLRLTMYIERTFVPPNSPVQSPQLIKLSLCFGSFPKEGQIADIMRTLHLPNLKELSVELYFHGTHDRRMDQYIRALLPLHEKFPRLNDFQLSIRSFMVYGYCLDMPLVFSLLPTLHNVTLELPDAHLDFGDHVDEDVNIHAGSALRSLRLIKCHLLTDDFIEDVLPMIRGGTGEDAFSLLEIRDCKKLSRSRVEAMLRPEEKLLWSQRVGP